MEIFIDKTVWTLKKILVSSIVHEYDIFNMSLQLFLLKKGGQEIYVGPLGRHSCNLIKYFEVFRNQKFELKYLSVC